MRKNNKEQEKLYFICIHKLTAITGWLNLILGLAVFLFFIVTLYRKSKLPLTSWIGLILLDLQLLIAGICSIIVIYFAKNDHRLHHNVHLLIDDCDNFVLFNLSVFLGFKALVVGKNMVNFAIKGTLLSARQVKRLNMITYVIWVFMEMVLLGNLVWCI